MSELSGFPRPGGRVGARDHLLVLPSVICASRVAREIADAAGAVSIVHQHGCSQVGDDATRTGDAFECLATNANVGAVLVVSLGCETLQGEALAERIAARGQRIAFVGIQDAGGSERAFEAGRAMAAEAAAELARTPRAPAPLSGAVVGIEASRPSAIVAKLVAHAAGAGAAVVLAEAAAELLGPETEVRCAPAYVGAAGDGVTLLEDAGREEQQHVALASAGAQVIVSFPDPDAAPVGFPICPVVTVAGESVLHQAIADDFDLTERAGAEAVWQRVLDVHRGAATAGETGGSVAFALERLTMTL